ncbi:MAG: hypothetical protein R6U37_03880 [Dehalococcoidia bacterium]
MYLTIEVEHIIREGQEKEALKVIKELYSKGLDYPASSTNSKSGNGLMTNGNVSPGLDIGDAYRDHLGRILSQVRQVADPLAKVKVRLTT